MCPYSVIKKLCLKYAPPKFLFEVRHWATCVHQIENEPKETIHVDPLGNTGLTHVTSSSVCDCLRGISPFILHMKPAPMI